MPNPLARPFKAAIKRALANNRVWKVLDTLLLGPIQRIEALRAQQVILATLTVGSGPFKGMKYPDAVSRGSVLFPKLVGCYERELHPLIEQIARTPYADVADIGCAEGYYAVGLAMRIPSARIHAYDTDPHAVDACRRMAQANGVAGRVDIQGFCSAETLGALATRSPRLLVVCDCEGYEKELFTPACAAALAKADVLVETHDFLVPATAQVLKERFGATHEILEIPTLADRSREETFHYEETRRLSSFWRACVLSEFRPAPQTFLFLRAKP